MVYTDDCRQLLRSSGTVGANYLEACEAVSRKDFVLRLRICRKEARESLFWLELLRAHIDTASSFTWNRLHRECEELVKIFITCVKTAERSSS
jgi:four helix bundle protein